MKVCKSLGIDKFLYFVLFIFCFSCSVPTDSKLNQALELSGKNRIQLEKVLKYYSVSSKDSLKYKAACFLIENMPYYYYYEGKQLDQYAEYYSLLYNRKDFKPTVVLDSIRKKYGEFSLSNLKIKHDINEVDSAYLCNNIEWSFKVWQEQPWCKNVSFDDFCEYILPYRLGNEKLVYWKEKLYNSYKSLFEEIKNIPDIENPVTAARILTDSLRKAGYRFTTEAPPSMPRLGPNVSKYLCGTCQDITDFTMYACRALGIPCHVDFMPIRGDGNSGHFWISYNDNEQKLFIQDFLGVIMPVRSSHIVKEFEKIKVYRYQFSQNWNMSTGMLKLEKSVYQFFNKPHFTDVTVYYADCFAQTVTIPESFFNKKRSDSKIAYLCLSNRNDWIPVCWTQFNRGDLQFDNIGKGNVVRVATWENEQLVFQTPPFMISSPLGELTLFSALDNTEKITLFSKMNLKSEDMYINRMVNGVFEGSNTPTFIKKDTLFQISKKPYRLLTEVSINTNKKYRYVRYFGPYDGFCNVSEVVFYEDSLGEIPLKGKIIGTIGCFDSNTSNIYTNVFDKKTDTSFDYKDQYGGWAGLDLGTAKKVSKIVYTPRNRDNYIRPGDTYELFFCSENDWVSLGVVKAQSDSISFTKVPKRALLYLKNNTRGVDERIFTYEKGKQVWK